MDNDDELHGEEGDSFYVRDRLVYRLECTEVLAM